MSRKLMVPIVVYCLLSAAVWAADDEQLTERPLTGDFLLIAQDGVLHAHGDFSDGRFFALPKETDWKALGAPQIFENTDRTLFLFYLDTAGFYTCHFNETGWKTQREDRFVPASIAQEDAVTFMAVSHEYEYPDDKTAFKIIKMWKGVVVEREILWKLLETQREVYEVGGGGGRFGDKCGVVRRGGRLPEWSQITAAQRGGSTCIVQRNNYQKDRRRFQIGLIPAEGQAQQLRDGPAFDFAAPVSKEAIKYFHWNGKDVESLDVLMSAVETKMVDGKSVEYLRWFVFKEAGARCDEPFEKQWQGRELLRLLTPVEK